MAGLISRRDVMSKVMTICFPHGGIIPAEVLGLEKDKACAALEAIDVPEVYGQHLIDDRFAIKVEKPKGDKVDKKSSNAAAEKAAQVAAEKAAALAAAEQAVKDAEAAVTAAGEDLVAKAAATEALDAASAALAALKA